MTPKIVRTPKEWTETCRECRGSGKVHKRERFALWTPEEYMATSLAEYGPPTLKTNCKVPDGLPANAVVCYAHGGASIFEACKEGVSLALAYQRPVVFEFNEAVAICHADSDPTEVAKRWWKLAYGKTYEESARDR